MKKILGLVLAALLLFSMVPTAMAADTNPASEGTTISVTGTKGATYEVTVPAVLALGQSGTVTASGTWAANQTLKVTCPTSVNLANGSDTISVGIEFAGIEEVGNDNGDAESAIATVTVGNVDMSAYFGTWTGTLTYTVEMVTDEVTGGDSSSGDTTCTHVDADSDGLCDSCGETVESGSGDESTTTYAATFADNSWADIAAACQNNEVPDTWVVGNTKTMTINEAEYDVAIIGKNYDTYADGSGVAPLTFMLIEPMTPAAMNSTDTTDGGWPASEMRSMLNETIINTLEDDIKNNIKAVKKTTVAGAEDQTGDSLVYDESEDKLFLLSTAEFESSGTRYEYFNDTHFNSNNPLYNQYWWLRSPWSNYEGYFKCHSSAYSYSGNSPASHASQYIFGFCFGCNHPNAKITNKVDVTCSTNGYTGDIYCNDCGADITGSIVTATGCVDANGDNVCDICGKAPKYLATFADNSWDNIAAACQNNEVPATWCVGDTKTTTINGVEYNVTIIGKNHDTYADGSGVAPLTFQTDIVSNHKMNTDNTSAGGWAGSDMYTYLNTDLIESLVFKDNIKAVVKSTNKGYYDSGKAIATEVVTSNDKLFLLSVAEVGAKITGTGAEVYDLEGSRYEYYTDAASRIKSYEGTTSIWWLRTPSHNKNLNFCDIVESGGIYSYSNARCNYGVSFGFCF